MALQIPEELQPFKRAWEKMIAEGIYEDVLSKYAQDTPAEREETLRKFQRLEEELSKSSDPITRQVRELLDDWDSHNAVA